MLLPRLRSRRSLRLLLHELSSQGIDNDVRNGKYSPAAYCLQLDRPHRSIDSLHRLLNRQLAPLDVHISPAQTESFASSKSATQHRHVQVVEALSLRPCQETIDLFAAQRDDLPSRLSRSICQSRGVPTHKTPLHCPAQRRS